MGSHPRLKWDLRASGRYLAVVSFESNQISKIIFKKADMSQQRGPIILNYILNPGIMHKCSKEHYYITHHKTQGFVLRPNNTD